MERAEAPTWRRHKKRCGGGIHLLERRLLIGCIPQAPESSALFAAPPSSNPAVNSKEGQQGSSRASRRDTDDSNPRQGRHQHAPNTTASFNIAYQTYSGMAEPAPVGREVIYCGGKQQPPPGHQWKPSISSCSCDAIPREPRQREALNRPRLKIERPTWLTSISNSVHSPTRGTNPFFESRPSLRKHPPSET
jgi:hypothetical protein